MYRQTSQFPVPAIVLGRILAILFLLTIIAIYFVGESLGLIPSIVGERQVTPEERRALAKHNSEVKRLIATRNARAANVRAADQADIAAQTARDAPVQPSATLTQTAASDQGGKSELPGAATPTK